MKKLRWLGAGGVAGLALALAFAGSATAGHAIASYQSARLDVSGPTKLGANGTTTIHVVLASTDDPTAKATIFLVQGERAIKGLHRPPLGHGFPRGLGVLPDGLQIEQGD